MLASELLGSKWLDEHEDIDITGIAYDSRNVLPGNVFVCIKGFETDGHKYAEMAVKNGASLIVAEDKIDVDVPVCMLKIRELKLRKWLVSITAIRQANSNLSVSQAQTVRLQ